MHTVQQPERMCVNVCVTHTRTQREREREREKFHSKPNQSSIEAPFERSVWLEGGGGEGKEGELEREGSKRKSEGGSK
jgi:hypothetical protein